MHQIIDTVISKAEAKEFVQEWPESPHWVTYKSIGEHKSALNCCLPQQFSKLVNRLNNFCPGDLVTDPSLYGAGLHELPLGGFLKPHLDCDVHPITKYRRAQNAILFLDDFKPDWGGDLYLYESKTRITPKAGRLVIFDCTDTSVHGVPGPVLATRRTVAVYWWEVGKFEPKRRRAQFVSVSGDNPTAEELEWRRTRSR